MKNFMQLKTSTSCICHLFFLMQTSLAIRKVEIGVLVQTNNESGAWSREQRPHIISSIVDELESSNWVIEENQKENVINYEALFNSAYNLFEKNNPSLEIKATLRKLSVNKRDGFNEVIDMINANQKKCDAFVYGFFTDSFNDHRFCAIIDDVTSLWDIPKVSWSCSNNEHRKKSNFLSVLPSSKVTSKAMTSVLRHFQWRKIAVLHGTSPFANELCSQITNDLLSISYFSLHYYKSFSVEALNSKWNETQLNSIFANLLQHDVSAVVICWPYDRGLFDSGTGAISKLLNTAYKVNEEKAKMLPYLLLDSFGLYNHTMRCCKDKGQHHFQAKEKRSFSPRFGGISPGIKVDGKVDKGDDLLLSKQRLPEIVIDQQERISENEYQSNSFPKHLEKRSPEDNDDNSSFVPSGEPQTTVVNQNQTILEKIYENVIIVSPLLENHISQHLLFQAGSKHVDINTLVYLLDALYVAIGAAAMQQSINESNSRFVVDDRKQQMSFTREFSFSPLSTLRHFDYAAWDIVIAGGVVTLQQALLINTTTTNDDNFYKITELNGLTWSSYGQPPQDTCKKESIYFCHRTEGNGFYLRDFIMVIACSLFIYFCMYIFGVIKRKRKEWRSLIAGPNKLFLTTTDVQTATSFTRSSPLSRDYGFGSRVGSFVTFLEGNGDDNKDRLGILKGEYVFIKPLSSEIKDYKRTTRETLRQLRELRHENLCSFHGLFTNEGYHFLVMEYAIRKSLKELLQNKDCELNMTFKISLLYDLVRGMKYLHSTPVHCHGRLKSRNCVVDGRFVLKITDYGVNQLLGIVGTKSRISDTAKDLLWTAPELLNDPTLLTMGTQKGDAYSFAIICQEVILRQDPYSSHELSSDEIVEKLKNSPASLRPNVPNDCAPNEILQIMKQCWQEEPEIRLTFSAIHSEMKRLNKGKAHNIVENMMQQLQDHSTHLEDIVSQRTMELQEEKKKTESLLMRMLPPSVAKLLIANKPILPETFDSCTIYFSDICGFTSIAHSSTPLQVVDFLNDLYTCFDAIIANHEVYKVETIGDAYMVSSGIPKVIGDRHAEEAAIMALDIISATITFKIRHLPHIKLRIRIGIHSGSAVAGVVGLTMPRYCLFGDTINTASRLETSGVPSRIHLSSETKAFLDKSTKKFKLQERGKIELKGLGSRTTWWLLGMEGFNKPLPDPGEVAAPKESLKTTNTAKPEGNKSANNSTMVKGSSENVEGKAIDKHETTFGKRHSITSTTSTLSRSGSSFVVSTPLAFVSPMENPLPSEIKRNQFLPTNKKANQKQLNDSSNRKKTSKLFGRKSSIAPCSSTTVNTISRTAK